MRKELDDRENINFLIKAFYTRVQEDEMLGPIFNSIIQDWPEHFERLTDFWETNLLFTRAYKGNPILVHNNVDRRMNNMITMEHFGRWLQLWFESIDEHFIGKHAENAKNRARNLSTHMFLKIYESRTTL